MWAARNKVHQVEQDRTSTPWLRARADTEWLDAGSHCYVIPADKSLLHDCGGKVKLAHLVAGACDSKTQLLLSVFQHQESRHCKEGVRITATVLQRGETEAPKREDAQQASNRVSN